MDQSPAARAQGALAQALEPRQGRLEWPIAKPKRRHVHDRIDAAELPVRHETRRTGSPHTLVLTKTNALFERAAAERKAWQTDLDWLEAAGSAPSPSVRASARRGGRQRRR